MRWILTDQLPLRGTIWQHQPPRKWLLLSHLRSAKTYVVHALQLPTNRWPSVRLRPNRSLAPLAAYMASRPGQISRNTCLLPPCQAKPPPPRSCARPQNRQGSEPTARKPSLTFRQSLARRPGLPWRHLRAAGLRLPPADRGLATRVQSRARAETAVRRPRATSLKTSARSANRVLTGPTGPSARSLGARAHANGVRRARNARRTASATGTVAATGTAIATGATGSGTETRSTATRSGTGTASVTETGIAANENATATGTGTATVTGERTRSATARAGRSVRALGAALPQQQERRRTRLRTTAGCRAGQTPGGTEAGRTRWASGGAAAGTTRYVGSRAVSVPGALMLKRRRTALRSGPLARMATTTTAAGARLRRTGTNAAGATRTGAGRSATRRTEKAKACPSTPR